MSEEYNPYMQPETQPENTASKSPRDVQQPPYQQPVYPPEYDYPQQPVYPPGYDYSQQPAYPPGYDYPQQPVYPPQYGNYVQQVTEPQPQRERRSAKPLVSFILSCVSMMLSFYASFFFFLMIKNYNNHVEKISGLERYSSDYGHENANYFFGQGFLRFFADCVFLLALGAGITAITFAVISINKKRQGRVFSILALCIALAGIIFASISAIVMINTVF